MDKDKITRLAEPFYEQFKLIGEMFMSEVIDKSFVRQARRFYGKQYFNEIKYLKKQADRTAKWAYKDEKRASKLERRKNKRRDKHGFFARLRTAFAYKAAEPQTTEHIKPPERTPQEEVTADPPQTQTAKSIPALPEEPPQTEPTDTHEELTLTGDREIIAP